MSAIETTLYYTESHEWIKVEGEFAYIGITDYSQKQLGDIKYIDSGEISQKVEQGDEFGSIESTKATSDLLTPVSGSIVEVNKVLIDSPELINKDPYTSWIIKIKLSKPSEIDNLMDYSKYLSYIKKNEAK